jgi:GntR family transcriptional regulator
MVKIDRNSPMPLYYQLKQLLIEKLDSTEWKPGDLVPSELELVDKYNLSRTTVRQALAELTFEGRLVRHRGQGTFVASQQIIHDPTRRISITELMKQQGINPKWNILERKFIAPLDKVQEALNVTDTEQVFYVELQLFANREPIGRHLVFLPAAVAKPISAPDTDEEELREFLRNLPNRTPIGVKRAIQAVPAGKVEAKLLNLRAGEPVLSIEVIYSDEHGNPLEYLRANYRGDSFKFELNN